MFAGNVRRSIRVQILKDRSADREGSHGGGVAEVLRQNCAAASHGRSAKAVLGGIGIGGWRGVVTGGQSGGDHLSVIGAVGEPGEKILATVIGDFAVEQDGPPGIGVEIDQHIGQAGFAGVLRGIAVGIGENGVANGARVIHPEVQIFHFISRSDAEEEGNRGGPGGECHRDVWIRRVVGHGIRASRRQEHIHSIHTGGGSHADRSAIGVRAYERNGDVGQDGFTWIKHAISVGVIEDMAFHFGNFEETEVRRGVVLTSCQGDSFLGAGAGLHAGGQTGVRAAGRGKHLLLFHLHDVVPRGKVVEEIRSAVTGGCESKDGFTRIQLPVVIGVTIECHHSIRNGDLTCRVVLNLVTVEIIPNVIPDAAVVVIAEVGGENCLTIRGVHLPHSICRRRCHRTASADQDESDRKLWIAFHHVHHIAARAEAGEEIVAIGVGAGRV